MVAEIKPGLFQCERLGCDKTFQATTGTRKDKAQARRQARIHEGRNSAHVYVNEVSGLADAMGMGYHPEGEGLYVVLISKKKGFDFLSTRPLTEYYAQVEAAVFRTAFKPDDWAREEKIK